MEATAKEINPLLTIITATHNASIVLPGLLESLGEQLFRDFELIVQDADSSDATLAVLDSYRAVLPLVSVVSEKDHGIYDAWNKALSRAKGEWVLFLGADDRLFSSDTLGLVAQELHPLPCSIDFFTTSLLLTLPDGQPVETWTPDAEAYEHLPYSMPLPNPALFYRRKLFAENRFSPSLRIAGDYDFLCRTLRQDNYVCSSLVTSRMSIGGVSGSLPSMMDSELECLKVSRKYYPHSVRVKMYARLLRSAGYRIVSALLGDYAGRILADAARICQGKPRLWTRKSAKAALPILPAAPLFSLVVATVKRKKELDRLLESLTRQEYKNFEILIADQNPPGMLDAVLAPFEDRLVLRRVVLPATGVSNARNALLPLAQGEIIAFPDDDCWYLPHTLKEVRALFAHRPDTAGLLVSWSDKPEMTGATRIESVGKIRTWRTAETFLQFYRRKAIEGITFDPELGPGTGLSYGCGEDSDFLLQVLRKGHRMIWTSEVLVLHARPDFNDPNLPSKARAYAFGRMHLLRKHHFPLWFKLVNIVYPLCRLPLEGAKAWPYRKAMFLGRLEGLFRG